MKTYKNGAIKGRGGLKGVPERIKCVREMRHMTQEELANKTKLKPSAISHFETGNRMPCARNIRKLCLVLNCSSDYILDIATE